MIKFFSCCELFPMFLTVQCDADARLLNPLILRRYNFGMTPLLDFLVQPECDII